MLLADVEEHARRAATVAVDGMPIDLLRGHRRDIQGVEAQVSFIRRVVQVRLDLLLAFVETDSELSARRADVLLAALPDVIRIAPVGVHRRPPSSRAMIRPDEELVTEAERAAGFDVVALEGRSDAEISGAISALTGFERRVSAVRRELHRLLDDIQSEIARRYTRGELVVGG